jgi:hypothetical protein
VTDETEQPDGDAETDSHGQPSDSGQVVPEVEPPSEDSEPTKDIETAEPSDKQSTDAGNDRDRSRRALDELLAMPGKPWSPGFPITEEMQERFREILRPIQNIDIKSIQGFDRLQASMARIGDIPIANLPQINALTTETIEAVRKMALIGFEQQGLFDDMMRTPEMLATFENLYQANNEQRKIAAKFVAAISQPSFARETQEFFATTEGLRYTSEETVWHYTSGWVLSQVLNKHLLWASAPQNLNDASEVKHGIEIIVKAFREARTALLDEADPNGRAMREQIKKATRKKVKRVVSEVLNKDYHKTAMNEIYLISGSTNQDSLTLWRNYSKNDGYAIGFDSTVDLSAGGLVFDPDSEDTDIRDDIPLISGWYQVTYKDRKKKKLADDFVADAIKDIIRTGEEDLPVLIDELRRHVLILASTMKHKAFHDEQEVRWITTNWSPLADLVHYEHTRNLVPVLYIKASSSDGSDPLPIEGVRCSPLTPPGSVRTVQGFLVKQGYEGASKNVKKSKQPFTG